MRNKIFAWLLCLTLLLPQALSARAESRYTVAEVESLCDGIVAYKEAQYGAYSVQDLIDGGLCGSAGISAEFYIIALSQRGSYDFSSYERALLSYLSSHEVYSASSREKYALALSASGSTNAYIGNTADEAIGGLGLMSFVFGLHLLNNGYTSRLYTVDGLIGTILSYQLSDGGWAVMGSYGDADVTAMTLQSLAPYYGVRGDVTAAADAALELLSHMQQESGAYKGMGVENCESTAQVLTALSDLGIDAQYDSRFIKNGNSVLDGMLLYRNADGSFTHTGGGYNESATEEAFYSLTAYLRMCYGQGPLYVLDHARHDLPASGGGGTPKTPGTSSRSDQSGTVQNDHDTPQEGEQSGGRIIVIDGQRYIEATTASGEKVTVNVGETEAQLETAAVSPKPTHGSFQPDATAAPSETQMTATADEAPISKGSYKGRAIAGVALAAGIACLVLFLLKKRGKKHYIAVGILAAAGVLFILLTNFESVESYHETVQTDGDFTVTMTIRCDTITGREKVNDFIPDDGVILAPTDFSASEGDTVFQILYRASQEYGIAIDNRGGYGAAYLAGINHLYEFDYGDLSGWMYRVNGVFPDVGCQSYTVHSGDTIEWLYTTNIGKDLE